MQMKRLLLFLFLGFFVITIFMQKRKKWKQSENQTFNMNLLNENIIAQNVANNVITSPFGMGEGFFKQSDYYKDLWTTVGKPTVTQLR